MNKYHEPWKAYRSVAGDCRIRAIENGLIAKDLSSLETAERIVICVNALFGVANEDIEKVMDMGSSFALGLVGLKWEVEEMLNALEPFALVGLNPDPTNPPAECYVRAAEVWRKYGNQS